MINRILNRPSRKELSERIEKLQFKLAGSEAQVLTASRDWAKTDCALRSEIENLTQALGDSKLECKRLGAENMDLSERIETLNWGLKDLEKTYDLGFAKMVKEKNAELVKLQTELNLLKTKSEAAQKVAVKQNISSLKEAKFWSSEHEKLFELNRTLNDKLEKFEAEKAKRSAKNAEFMRLKRLNNPNYGRGNKK